MNLICSESIGTKKFGSVFLCEMVLNVVCELDFEDTHTIEHLLKKKEKS